MRRRALGWAAFAAVAAGGAALGWAAERRGARGLLPDDDAHWAELAAPVVGRPVQVRSSDGTLLHAEVLEPHAGGRHRDTPDRPTLVFAHGFGLSQHAWQYQRRDLRDEFRLVCYDQRGHADSGRATAGDYSIDAFGRDLAAVLEATTSGPVVLIGHSLGGMAILSYVEQHPEENARRVAGAVFVDTSPAEVVAGGALSTGMAAAGVLRSRVVDGAFHLLGRGADVADRAYRTSSDLSFLVTRALGTGRDAPPAVVAFVEQLLLNCPNDVKAAIGPVFTALDLRQAAGLLDVPVLVLVGDEDRLTPVRSAERLVDLLPQGRLEVLEGAGHSAMLEVPEVVNAHLRTFARRAFGAAPAERQGVGPRAEGGSAQARGAD